MGVQRVVAALRRRPPPIRPVLCGSREDCGTGGGPVRPIPRVAAGLRSVRVHAAGPTSVMKLSVVTTIYRSADAIEEFHARARRAVEAIGAEPEIIFVNDGSPDNALDVARRLVARDPSAVLIDLSRNFGQHRALWTGLQHATGDLVAVLDGDLEEDPLWLIDFHTELRATRCDVV